MLNDVRPLRFAVRRFVPVPGTYRTLVVRLPNGRLHADTARSMCNRMHAECRDLLSRQLAFRAGVEGRTTSVGGNRIWVVNMNVYARIQYANVDHYKCPKCAHRVFLLDFTILRTYANIRSAASIASNDPDGFWCSFHSTAGQTFGLHEHGDCQVRTYQIAGHIKRIVAANCVWHKELKWRGWRDLGTRENHFGFPDQHPMLITPRITTWKAWHTVHPLTISTLK